MFSQKGFCNCCNGLYNWLLGITLVVIGGVVLLQKLGSLPETVFGWVWPITVLVWGITILYHSACKDCHK